MDDVDLCHSYPSCVRMMLHAEENASAPKGLPVGDNAAQATSRGAAARDPRPRAGLPRGYFSREASAVRSGRGIR
jgi:hypothetical protein